MYVGNGQFAYGIGVSTLPVKIREASNRPMLMARFTTSPIGTIKTAQRKHKAALNNCPRAQRNVLNSRNVCAHWCRYSRLVHYIHNRWGSDTTAAEHCHSTR